MPVYLGCKGRSTSFYHQRCDTLAYISAKKIKNMNVVCFDAVGVAHVNVANNPIRLYLEINKYPILRICMPSFI